MDSDRVLRLENRTTVNYMAFEKNAEDACIYSWPHYRGHGRAFLVVLLLGHAPPALLMTGISHPFYFPNTHGDSLIELFVL